MSLLLWLIVIATVLNGGLAGVSLEGSLVKLPARRRIGVVAYATFARGNDLGNGLVVYPFKKSTIEEVFATALTSPSASHLNCPVEAIVYVLGRVETE